MKGVLAFCVVLIIVASGVSEKQNRVNSEVKKKDCQELAGAVCGRSNVKAETSGDFSASGEETRCEGESCARFDEEEEEDNGEDTEPRPDIPVELGSSMMSTDSDVDTNFGVDEMAYFPMRTPVNFVARLPMFRQPKAAMYSPTIFNRDQIKQPQYSGDNKHFTPDDGDYDGELLRKKTSRDFDEASSKNRSEADSMLIRRRRDVIRKPMFNSNEKRNTIRKLKNKVSKRMHKSEFHKKRSDIDDDQELLKTIERLDPDIAGSKRDDTSKKPLAGYMQNLAHDVRSVMGEAKDVLRHTGKVVHGLKRVISGATVLTSFTDNAVKFAKYFSMEPNNATIDYLEEKAIVAVLEAQKAANEARDAANMAKTASKKAKTAAKRMMVAEKSHKNIQGVLDYVRTAAKQATRAEKAAKLAASEKQKTENNVMLMDKELKVMGAQLKAENEKQQTVEEPHNNLAKNFQQQYSPEAQQLLVKSEAEMKEAKEIENKPGEPSKEEIAGGNKRKMVGEDKPKENTYDYFLLKQKELENKHKVERGGSTEDSVRKTTLSNSSRNSTKVKEGSKLSDVFSSKQMEYIMSLDERIASMKREEETAKQILMKAQRSSGVNQNESSPHDTKIDSEVKNSFDDAANKTTKDLEADPVRNTISTTKNNVPDRRQMFASYEKHPLTKEVVPVRYHTIKKKKRHNSTAEKKQEIVGRRRGVHLVPGEYTGFKKNEIIYENDQRNVINSFESKSLRSQIEKKGKPAEGFEQLVKTTRPGDENSVVAEDFDQARKRDMLLAESKRINENLLHLARKEAENNAEDVSSGSGDDERKSSVLPEPVLVRKIEQGPLHLTVAVRHNVPSLVRQESKSTEVLDPFGFKKMSETNEGGIVGRRTIPHPEVVKKVPEYNLVLDSNKDDEEGEFLDL